MSRNFLLGLALLMLFAGAHNVGFSQTTGAFDFKNDSFVPELAKELLFNENKFPTYNRDFVWGHHIWSLQGKVGEMACHDSSINRLAVSPDGQTLATASSDKTVCIWDLKTQRKIRTLKYKWPVRSARFLKEPNSLVSLSDGVLQVWDVTTGKLSFAIDKATKVDCFDCANNEVVFAIDNQVYLFDLATKQTAQVKSFDSEVTFVAISKDGKQFVNVRNKSDRTRRQGDRYAGFVSVFETKSGKSVLEMEKKPGVYAVAFSPDGKTLALGWSKTLLTVELESGREFQKKGHRQSIRFIEFSADGRQVATASDNEIIQWSMFGPKPDRSSFFTLKRRLEAIAFAPDNRTIISSTLGGINFWNAAKLQPQRLATGQPITKLSISKRSADSVIATVTPGGEIEVWDVNYRKKIQTLNPKGRVDRVVFSRSAYWLAVLSGPKLSIWSLPLGRKIKSFQLYDPEKPADNPQAFNQVGSCSFSANDKFLAATCGNRVKVWDVKSGNIVYSHAEHKLDVLDIEFGSDSLLASASLDKTIRIVDVERKKLVATFEGHNAPVGTIAFSPDQQLLVSGSDDKNVKVWDLGKNRAIRTIAFHSKPVIDVDFSPDGKCISSASEDKGFAIWNTTEIIKDTDLRDPLPRFTSRFGGKDTAQFLGDGHSFVASDEKGLLLWRSILGMELATVKINRPYFVKYAPETSRLAVCARDGITIRDSRTGVSTRTLTKSEEKWRSIAFSPGGTYLAAVSAEDRLRGFGRLPMANY